MSDRHSRACHRRDYLDYLVEKLEDRRLFAGVEFGSPSSTALPAGFVPQKVISAFDLGLDSSSNDVLVTGQSGGGIILQAQADGTFSVLKQINTSATIFGVGQLPQVDTFVPALFTTAGLMTLQSDGSFALTSHINFPSDYVPGAFATGEWFNSDGGTLVDLIVERFKPNPENPSLGDILLAGFRQKENGTLDYNPEVDTTVATDVPPPQSNQPLIAVNIPNLNFTGLLVGNTVWISNGDDTFHQGSALDMTTAESVATRYPADFSSDIYGGPTNTLAVFPAPSTLNAGYDTAQLFANNGNDLLQRALSVNIAASGSTAGPLVFDDLDIDGTTDLATAIVNGPDAPAVVVVPQGIGGYLNPILTPLPGLVGVEGINPADFGLICFTAKVQPDGSKQYALTTLPDEATSAPLVELGLPDGPVRAAQPVTLTVLSSQQYGGPVYSTFTLFDDGAPIAKTTTSDTTGLAQFSLAGLSAGVHTLTVGMSDGSPVVPVPPTLLSVGADPTSGLLFASEFNVRAPSTLVPGSGGTFSFKLTDLAGGRTVGTASVSLFASASESISEDSVKLTTAGVARIEPNLSVKQSRLISGRFTLPSSTASGTYYLIAQVTAGGKTSTQVVSSPLVDSSQFKVVWEFGTVGSKQNVKFVTHLKTGNTVTFALTGEGYGTVSPSFDPLTLGDGNPNFDVMVLNTAPNSNLTISQTGSKKSNILNLLLNDELGTVDVRTDTPHNIVTGITDPTGDGSTFLYASEKRLLLGVVPPAQATSNPPISTQSIIFAPDVGQLAATSIDNAAVTIGTNSNQNPKVEIGTLGAGASFTSDVPVSDLEVGTALPGSSIVAPRIGKLTATGDFSASMTLGGLSHTSTVLGAVDLAKSLSGTQVAPARWSINGNVGTIRIGGSVAYWQFLAGAKPGPLGQLTPPAAFSGVSVASVMIGGSVASSLLAAGLDPVDGVLLNGNDQLLPGGSFGSIVIGGSASKDTRIVASSLPSRVLIDHQMIVPSQDSRFEPS